MKISWFKLFILMSTFLAPACAFAESDVDVSELMKQRAQHKVAQLTDNISFMADKSKSLDTRQYYRGKALKLFIANGEPYEVEGEKKDGVVMETTSTYRRKPNRQLMKDYFTKLINLRYSKVDIQSTKVHDIEVSDIHKIGDNLYVCSAYFEQEFRGFRDGKPVYGDRTRKKATVYIYADETVDRIEYMVFLGDVTALETERL